MNQQEDKEPNTKMRSDLNRYFAKEDNQIANRHMKRYSASLIEGKC